MTRNLWRRPAQPNAVGIARRAGRLDWLLLLPPAAEPNPIVVCLGGFDPDEREHLSDHFGTDVITDSLGDESVDVLLVRAAADVDVGAALSTLGPSGIAYVERVRRWSFGSGRDVVDPLHSTRRAARGIHATELGSYWLLPEARNPRRFVPLDHAGAIRWYLSHLLIPTGPVDRWGRWMLARLPRLTPIAASAHAIVLARGPARSVQLFEAADEAVPGSEHSVSAIVTTSGSDAGSRSIALLFGDAQPAPTVAVKVAGRPTMNVTTEREFASVRELQSALPSALLETVPRAFGLISWKHRAAIVEEAVSGQTVEAAMGQSPDPEQRIFELERATAWVTDLGRATAEPRPWSTELCERWVGGPLDTFTESYEPDGPTRALFDRTNELAAELIGRSVPFVRRHYDYGPWNMIGTAQGLRVIDWEITPERPVDRRGPPLCDLSCFVKNWLHSCANVRHARDAASLFEFSETTEMVDQRFVAAGRLAIARYCRDLSIDPAFIPVLTVHAWVERAVDGARRAALIGRPRSERVLAFDYIESLARQADELFDATSG